MAERVSVVINTLDRASSLRRTLRSLRQLDHRDLEVVVVCGPCRDDTEAVLAEFAGEIKVGRCPDANLSRSRNIGIRLAAGEFVAFIDDDAYPDPAWITRLLTGFRGPEVAAVGGPVFDYTGVLFQTRQLMVDWFGNWMQRSVDLGRWLSFPGSRWVPYAMGTNGIYRRSRLLEVGGFDEEIEYHIDETDLCRRLVDRGYVIAYVDDAYVYHKVLQSRLRTSERAYLSRYPILKNRAYFALRHARGRASMADLCADLTGYVELQRAELEENIATRGLDPGARERFRQDVARAYDDAWVSAHRPRRTRPRSWFEEENEEFLRFPTLRSAEEKLHVCLLTDEYLPAQLNGIARTIHTLATGLAERGHVVRVVLAGEEPGSVDLMDGVWVHRVPIRPHRCPPGFPHPAVWHHSASLLDELESINGQRPIDIVQAPNWGAPAIAALVEGRFPTVLSLHTPLKTVAQMDHRARRWGRTRKEYRRLIDVEARVYPLPDAYLASTPSIVDEIEEQYGIELDRNRTAYVGHGLPDITASVAANSRSEGDEVELLFVGRLEPRKGIDVLLACIPGLAAEFPHLRFTIVGKDDIPGPKGITYRQAFERSPEGARLRDRVRFTGLVSDEELWRHYAACDLFVAPSRYESFGLILVEAMMFGKPIVASDVGGMQRVVEPEGNGILVPPGHPTQLGEAIARLVVDESLRERFGRRSRQLYEERYSSTRMIDETLTLYQRLIQEKSKTQSKSQPDRSTDEKQLSLVSLTTDNGNQRGQQSMPLFHLLKRASNVPTSEHQGVWAPHDVAGGISLPDHTIRTYIEQSGVRKHLARAAREIELRDGCDVGAGFGRLVPVLGEFCQRVVAFEREPQLVEIGGKLLPSVEWYRVNRLDDLPAPDQSFDFVMTFTVLQHMTDEHAERVITELKRIVRRPGFILLCEESDPEHRWGPVGDVNSIFTIGRSVDQYAALLAPLELVASSVRQVEPTHPRTLLGELQGHYMLFKNK